MLTQISTGPAVVSAAARASLGCSKAVAQERPSPGVGLCFFTWNTVTAKADGTKARRVTRQARVDVRIILDMMPRLYEVPEEGHGLILSQKVFLGKGSGSRFQRTRVTINNTIVITARRRHPEWCPRYMVNEEPSCRRISSRDAELADRSAPSTPRRPA